MIGAYNSFTSYSHCSGKYKCYAPYLKSAHTLARYVEWPHVRIVPVLHFYPSFM